ncbi:MAG TPA: CBS domain-containing protein [Chloroflexi bacterium]|nr:CBS domain-containing protein [Chloroflexota bacterium]
MLVGDRMSHPVITIPPDMPVVDALNLMRVEHIRRTPVVDEKGKLVGIVSDKDLLNASPSAATTLSVWEINYLLSKINVGDVMTKDVVTITEDTPIEEAARIMADNKIGGLPVVRDGKVVGIITETDLFKILLEMMGARAPGVRVSILVPNVRGELALITKAIAEAGGYIISLGTFSGEDTSNALLTIKLQGLTEDEVRDALKELVEKFEDIRTMPAA